MRLDNVEIAEDRQPALSGASSLPVTASARKISLAGERGWSIAERSGIVTLARRHPLTIDGEDIGSFEVTIACGAKSGEYVVAYEEARQAGEGGGVPEALKNVDIRIGQKTAPLALATSSLNDQRSVRVSTASGIVPSALIKPLAEIGNRSLTVTTSSADNAATTIRIGNTGIAANITQLTSACAANAQTTHAGLVRAE
jgi:hypothetical protein